MKKIKNNFLVHILFWGGICILGTHFLIEIGLLK